MSNLKHDNEELVNQFFKLINYMSNEDDLAKTFGEKLVREHRTIQQSTIRFIAQVIEHYAKNHTGYDLRNEASVQWAESITRHHPAALPFI